MASMDTQSGMTESEFLARVRRALAAMGHGLATRGPIGCVQGIQVLSRPDGQRLLLGASDPRRNGAPVGLSGERLVSRVRLPIR